MHDNPHDKFSVYGDQMCAVPAVGSHAPFLFYFTVFYLIIFYLLILFVSREISYFCCCVSNDLSNLLKIATRLAGYPARNS